MLYPQDFFKHLLDNLYDGIYFVDRKRVITYWNIGAERLTGFKAEQVVGKSCSDNILNHCNDEGCELCKTTCPLTYTISTGKHQEAEVYLHHANGHRVPVLVRTSPIVDETGKTIGAVEIFSNNQKVVHARRRINALETKVFYDPLTGLGNRRNLEIQFHSALIQMKYENLRHGLLFIDIDYFKPINDQFGHNTGDRVLVMVAETLRSNLRDSDIIIRWGGEEFVVLLRDIMPQEAKDVAEKLRVLIESSSLPLEPSPIKITVSTGAIMLRQDDTIESAIQRADRAMYRSKTAGRNRVTFDE
jgi:diguanylate cyclase (GGDEF)-like protein/PAS domain S-box-containing protein